MTTAPKSASTPSSEANINSSTRSASRPQSRVSTIKNLFSIPAPLKRLFDQFPRRVYLANHLPARTAHLLPNTDPDSDQRHALFIWTAGAGCHDEWIASFNPTCLTWQIHLLLHRQPIQIVASSNHACSPGSALPLLIPNLKIKGPFTLDRDSLTTSDLERWLAKEQDKKTDDIKEEKDRSTQSQHQQKIWRALIDGPIRRAWLYHMYLTSNFDPITAPCYISPQTSHGLVQLELRRQLRTAAEEELLKHAPKIDEDSIYREAVDAFGAFEGLLTQETEDQSRSTPKNWKGLFGTTEPTGVDVSLFAYTFLLLGLHRHGWAHERLPDNLRKFPGLNGHVEWVLHQCLQGRLQVPSRWTEINTLCEG